MKEVHAFVLKVREDFLLIVLFFKTLLNSFDISAELTPFSLSREKSPTALREASCSAHLALGETATSPAGAKAAILPASIPSSTYIPADRSSTEADLPAALSSHGPCG